MFVVDALLGKDAYGPCHDIVPTGLKTPLETVPVLR